MGGVIRIYKLSSPQYRLRNRFPCCALAPRGLQWIDVRFLPPFSLTIRRPDDQRRYRHVSIGEFARLVADVADYRGEIVLTERGLMARRKNSWTCRSSFSWDGRQNYRYAKSSKRLMPIS
jgi:hypothetical protein